MSEKIRVFVSVRGYEKQNPVKSALQAIAEFVCDIVAKHEEADFIIVNHPDDALDMLKENDDATVLIAVMPGVNMYHNQTAARSLRLAYPDRVVVGQIFDVEEGSGDVRLVPYIIGLGAEKRRKTSNENPCLGRHEETQSCRSRAT